MSEKKKPSGSFYRKRRAEALKEKEKQAKLMKRFVTLPSISPSSSQPQVNCSDQPTETEQEDEAAKFDTCVVSCFIFQLD